MTQHAGWKSVSEKSQDTRTRNKPFEKSKSKTGFFVREDRVKDKRTADLEFLIGWCDYPESKYDTWETITNLPGSENMITEFNKKWEQDYKIRTTTDFNQ